MKRKVESSFRQSFLAIEELKKIDLTLGESYFKILEIIKFNISLPIIEFQIPVNETLFRGRINNEKSFSHKSDLSFNSKFSEVGLNRANYYKQPIFYASKNLETAIFELSRFESKKSFGDIEKITVGRWKVVKSFNVYLIIGDPKQLENDKLAFNTYNEYINKFDEDSKRDVVHILSFLSSAFSKLVNDENRNEYLLSAAIFNSLMIRRHNPENIAGIIYPSVAYEMKDINFAILPEFVDDCLILDGVGEFEIELLDENNGRIIQQKNCDIISFSFYE